MKSIKRNKYDYMLTVMVLLMIFGQFGSALQAVRVYILALFPFMFINAINGKHAKLEYYKYECIFVTTWVVFSIAFLYKSIELIESIKHVAYIIIHGIGFLEILWLACKSNKPQESLIKGWIGLIILTIPIAVTEFFTGFHLPTTLHEDIYILKVGGVDIERPFAAVSYGNLNAYNTLLCCSMPSLFIFSLYSKRKIDFALSIFLLISITLIIIANASRASILCLGMCLMTYFFTYMKIGKNKKTLITLFALAVFVLSFYLIDMFTLILERFDDQGMSDDGRSENIIKGLQALVDSYGLGIGIGNYAPIMGNIYNVLIPAPHNLFIEVIVVSGVIVFIGFMLLLIRIIGFGLRGEERNKIALTIGMVALIFTSIIDSNYVMNFRTWLFISSLYILTDSHYNLKYKA